MTDPTARGIPNPVASATKIEMGAIKVMVPTDVPIVSDTNAATMNSTTIANSGGNIERKKYATLSALERPTIPTNAPAQRKIRIIMTILGLPIPLAMISTFWLNLSFLF